MDNSKNEKNQEINIEETQEANSSASYLTENNDDREIKVNNSNRIIELLKNNLAIVTIATITVIVVAAVAVLAGSPQNEGNRLKDEINQKAAFIKESFHPNDIQIDSLSSPDLQLIKEFQIHALGVVNTWEIIHNMYPIDANNTTDIQELLNDILSRLDAINTFDKETTNVQTSVSSIIDYGKKNNIPQYICAADTITCLYEKAGKRDKYFNKTKQTLINDFTKLLSESATDPNSITKEKVAKVIAPLDELYNNKDVLDYTNTLFSWIVEVNTDYMDYLNYSKSK